MNAGTHASPTIDVLVIGAGVAGAAAAIHARANSDARVLLVERSTWPREKVCGCCVNAAGTEELRRLDVLETVKLHATRLTRVRVQSGTRKATLECLNSLVISRANLDAILAKEAQLRGVTFHSETSAKLIARHEDTWSVELREAQSTRPRTINARVVLIADGLNGGSLADITDFSPVMQAGSRMGVALHADGRESLLPPGEVHMLIAQHGYVGMVRLNASAIVIAAALDSHWAKSVGGPFVAIQRVLASTGEHMLPLGEHSLMGTGLLSRARTLLAQPGLLVVGDAAGYVEPFTGEGMTWALASGAAAGTMTACSLLAWSPTSAESLARHWTRWHAENIQPRHRLCRAVKWCTRHPIATNLALSALQIGVIGKFVARRTAIQMHSPYMTQATGAAGSATGATP